MAKLLLLEMAKNNGNCRFPCLWGVVPGKTTLQEKNVLFAPFGKVSEDGFSVGYDYSPKYEHGSFGFTLFDPKSNLWQVYLNYYDSGGKILRVWIDTYSSQQDNISIFGTPFYQDLLQYYLIPNLFTLYGQPSDILLFTIDFEPIEKAPYDPFITLIIYRDQGIMAEYITGRTQQGNFHKGCPGNGKVILRTWNPSDDTPLEKIADVGAGEGVSFFWLQNFKPIKDVTSFTVDSYYNQFMETKVVPCITTPVDAWQR